MTHSSALKRRHNLIISKTEGAFSKSLHNKEYERAAKIIIHAALSMLNTVGLIKVLDAANDLVKRSKQRKGL